MAYHVSAFRNYWSTHNHCFLRVAQDGKVVCNSGAPARRTRASGVPYLRKFGNHRYEKSWLPRDCPYAKNESSTVTIGTSLILDIHVEIN